MKCKLNTILKTNAVHNYNWTIKISKMVKFYMKKWKKKKLVAMNFFWGGGEGGLSFWASENDTR